MKIMAHVIWSRKTGVHLGRKWEAVNLMKSLKLREICLGAALILVGCPEGVQAQSLTSELRDLVNSHPQISAKIKAIDSAEAGVDAALAGFLPVVKLTGDGGAEYTDDIDRQNTQGKPFMRGTTDQQAVTVTQHLFDGYATDAAVGQADVSHSISKSELRVTRQTVLLEATNAYLNVLRWTHLIRLATGNVHNVQDQLNLEDERISKGAGMGLDALTAKQQLQTAKEARVRYEGELRTALANYIQVFGHPPRLLEMSEPDAPIQLLAKDMDEALETAELHNPAIESSRLAIDLSAERKRSAQAGYLPTLDLVGKADNMHDKNAETGQRKDWSVLLMASWEVFSGWKTDAQVAQASADHGAAMDTHVYTVRKTDELVRTKWERLTTAQERMGLLENAAALAEEVLAATRKLHAAGKETIFNVLDAENRLNDARINYAQAYYDMVSASFEVLNAMGELEVDAVERAQASGTLSIKRPDFLVNDQ